MTFQFGVPGLARGMARIWASLLAFRPNVELHGAAPHICVRGSSHLKRLFCGESRDPIAWPYRFS
jgi:hypothetical protein